MAAYTITYRAAKGSPLTNSEVDNNFQNLDTFKAPIDNPSFTTQAASVLFVGPLQGTVTDTGASQFGTGTTIGNGVAASSEVDFKFATGGIARFYHAVSTTNGGIFGLYANDDTGAYKYSVYSVNRATGVWSFNQIPIGVTPNLTDNSAALATTQYVQGQGYITANGTAKFVTTITSAQVTGALTYTPVQQGTGVGQGTNVIKIGWGTNTGNGAKITVDSSDLGWVPMSSTAPGTFTYSGAIVATGNVTAYSDESLKVNWSTLPGSFVDQLAQVKTGTFDRPDLDNARQVGVSAQSLQAILPEAVQENENGLLSVSYGNAALAACVELAKRVVALEQRLAAYEGK